MRILATDSNRRSLSLVGFVCLVCWVGPGCQSVAPIHVWTPPRIESALGRRLAIAPLSGDPRIAKPLHQAMLRDVPVGFQDRLMAIDARQLGGESAVRLVGHHADEPSEIALASLARREGIDLLLFGEVLVASGPAAGHVQFPEPVESDFGSGLPPRHDRWAPGRQSSRLPYDNVAAKSSDDQSETAETKRPPQILRVSWRLIDIRQDRPLAGMPVVSLGQADEAYDELIRKAANDAWELLTPHVLRDEAELASPRLGRGSALVRQGNTAAAEGRWPDAERDWRAAIEINPRSHAALHNLAIAAVARQDFNDARRRIGAALAQRSLPLYRSTAVWIELRQRHYHRAFGLPDPPEGWAATRDDSP